MRSLTSSEIQTLVSQNCQCSAWEKIQVADKFSTQHIQNVHFSGDVFLGEFSLVGCSQIGTEIHTGLYDSTLHNCTVANNAYINHCQIANYNIDENAYLENISSLYVVGESTFGNGTEVNVLNEAGGRGVKIVDCLSAQMAYVLALYPYEKVLHAHLNTLVDRYIASKKSTQGCVGENVRITNCKTIKNVNIGSSSTITNVELLENGTICSDELNRTTVENGVIAKNFIFGKGCQVFDYALVENSYIGEACHVGKQYSATDCLIFSNSELLHGEAAAVFAGPYTTSHHKSTLLIGCQFSFYNAGSGTNQSNHMYKIGPVHQGILERGCKTGSDSYLMLEAKAGAFSLILGHHEQHFDTSSFPFSYILSDAGKSVLIPAANFLTAGTYRDCEKWPKRDKRKGNSHLDNINFSLLNPFTISEVMNGISALNKMKEKQVEYHTHKNIRIKNVFVNRGIDTYQEIATLYICEKIAERIQAKKSLVQANASNYRWCDWAGMIVPKERMLQLLMQCTTIDAANQTMLQYDIDNDEWDYVCNVTKAITEKLPQDLTTQERTDLMERGKTIVKNFAAAIASDAQKDFSPHSKVSFGADGDDSSTETDFLAVRGSLADTSFAQSIENWKEKQMAKMEVIG